VQKYSGAPVRCLLVLETILAAYASRVRALDVMGSYVAGSVAMGAFDPRRSDVDVVTVVRGEVEPARIDRMHRELARAHPGAWRLDAQYVSARAPLARGPRGRLTAVARAELHAGGIVLAGGAIAEIVPPVSRAELDAEMRWNLDVYWRAKRARLERYLFAEGVHFAVTTVARIRWTLAHGTVVSKPAAARWLPSVMPDAAPLVAGLDARLGLRDRWARARAVQHLIAAAIIDGCSAPPSPP
jgi:hypothetical protein